MALAATSLIFHSRSVISLNLSAQKLHPNLKFHPNSPSFSLQTQLPNSRIIVCSSPAVDTTVSDVEAQSLNVASTATSAWSEFARNVSGEWDGFEATFSSEGKPYELPESVVPEAYREWEVKVFDWQTQCPTLAEPEECVLVYKSIKLLPTVGCEADAATRYTVDERSIGGVNNKVSAFAYQSNGSYVAIWPIEENGSYKILELEHCLINPQDKESRVRIIQVVRVDDSGMVLQNVKVFCELWYGPFRNGDQLGGCAIRDSAFATTPTLEASEIAGVWNGSSAVTRFLSSQTNFIQELVDETTSKSVRDECDLIMLPKQLWCSLKADKDNETCSEVGWLLGHGHAITSKCLFSGAANLKEISIASESAASEYV